MTLKMLMIAPFFYIAMGVWVFSNQQVFRDVVLPIESNELFPDSGHRFIQIFTQATPGSVFTIFAFLFVVTLVMR